MAACTPGINNEDSGKISRLSEGTFLLEKDSLRVTVSEHGGKIISAQWEGREVLYTKGDPINFGSTLWPSPQSRWKWPPPEVLDSQPYEVHLSNNSLYLKSKSDPTLGMAFVKIFKLDEKTASLQITYRIQNTKSDSSIQVAPWEVTRAPQGGLFFYPCGKDRPRPKGDHQVDYIRFKDHYFYKDPLSMPDKHFLTISDGGGGWTAYLRDQVLFVKQFPDILPVQSAPGEAEVEFYISATKPYLELEQQGSYQQLAPGESLDWTVKWSFRKVSGQINEQALNDDLLQVVKDIRSE